MTQQQDQFDAVVIGAGQGGTPLARAMAAHGWKVALVESRYLGGVCSNDGCTPTKTLLGSAHVAALAHRGPEFGTGDGQQQTDMRRVQERMQDIVLRSRKHMERVVGAVSGLELIYGQGRFAERQPGEGRHAVAVRLRDGGERTLLTERVFLDTGERPAIAPIEGLETVPYLESTSILGLQVLPRHLVILGGGYIAVEFAQIYRHLGAEVTVVEKHTQLLAREDEDIAQCLKQVLEEDGVHVLCGREVQRVRMQGEEIAVELDGETLTASHLLVATGRRPNTAALHADHAGVELTDKGYVRVNERLETTAPGVWALGDITGGPPFTHASYDDFRILRTNLLEGGSRTTADRTVPYCVFTEPELGRVGLSEREARDQGLDFRVAAAPMRMVARAHEESQERGMMKAIVERGSDRILGAAILGLGGGDVMTQLQIAMMGNITATQIREAIFVHPVLAEGLHVLFRNYRDEQNGA